MNPGEVIEGIGEYAYNGQHANMDIVIVAENIIYDVFGYIAGIIVIIISFGMLFITVLDLAYIALPTFRSLAREKRWDRSKGTSEDGGKYRLISSDARLAVEEAAIGRTGYSALELYLRKRVKAFILVAVMIYVSIAGSHILIPTMVRIVRGVLDAFHIVLPL